MKRPKNRSKGASKRPDPKRRKTIMESDSSDSSRYTRRCMSTELLQLLCLQRSFLNIAEHSQRSPRRQGKGDREKGFSPQPFVRISTWSLSTKEGEKEASDSTEKDGFQDKSNFQNFVNLYTNVLDFQSRSYENELDHDAHRSLSLPSIDELPSFTHLLYELNSYFNEDVEQFCEDNSTKLFHESASTGYLKRGEDKAHHSSRREIRYDLPQSSGFYPTTPNFVVASNVCKKSSLDDFLSRISRTAPKVCDNYFVFSNSSDLASRLQTDSSLVNDRIDRKACPRIGNRNKKKTSKFKEKSGRNSSFRKCARVRPSKSDSDSKQTVDKKSTKCCNDEHEKMTTFDKLIKHDRADNKRLLELFQLLFKKQKARERLNVISKLPRRKRSFTSSMIISKIGGRSCERTLEKRHDLSNSRDQPVKDTQSSLAQKDSLVFHAKNMEKSCCRIPSPQNLQIVASPPKNLGERPIPPPRKQKINIYINTEYATTDNSSKDTNDYSLEVNIDDSLNSHKNQYTSCSRIMDSSSTPSLEISREEKKRYISFADTSVSNSISSPNSTYFSHKDDEDLGLSLVRLKHQLSSLDKDEIVNEICDRFNAESYRSQRFWTDVMKALSTPVKRKKDLSLKSSKSTLIPGPFTASLTNLLKQKLPDVKLKDDFIHHFSSRMNSYHLPISSTASLPSCLNSSTVSSYEFHDHKAIIDGCFLDCHFKFREREDSVMCIEGSSSSVLRESPTSKCTSTVATSSDLVLDQCCWSEKQLILSESGMNLTPLKIFSKTALHEKRSEIEPSQTPEIIISNTILKDKVSIKASSDRIENNKVSVCVQTEVLNKCSTSTSFSNITRKTESNDSTMMIVKQLTKLHKLVSVPLSTAPLISIRQKSPEVQPKSRSKSRALRIPRRTIVKKVAFQGRSQSPLFKLRSISQHENIFAKNPLEAITFSEPSGIETSTSACIRNMALTSDKSSTSSKLRKIRTKKTPDKINSEKIKYFESRNRNISYRNATNVKQNVRCEDFKNSNYNNNVKDNVVGKESSSADDDVNDQTLAPLIANPVPHQESILSVNDKFSRFMNQGRYAEALETTFEKDFSVDREDPWSGERALVCAVVRSRHEIISRLLDLGSILDAPDYNGRTAFLASAIQVDHEAARLLLSHGIEVFCSVPLKVAHGRSRNIAQFAKFLELTLQCGYHPGKDLKWFETVLKNNSSDNEKDQELILTTRNLLSSCRQPSTLSMLCFVSIRHHLSKISKGRSIVSSVGQLPLPNLLKKFLRLEDAVWTSDD